MAKGRHRDLGQPLLLSPRRRRLSAGGGAHPLARLDQRLRRRSARGSGVAVAFSPCILRDAPWGAPQDDEGCLMASKKTVILSRPQSCRVEGRMTADPAMI